MPMVQPNIKQTIKNIVYDLCRLSVYIAALYILYDGDLDTFWTVFIILGIASCIVNRIKEYYKAIRKNKRKRPVKCV